MGLSIVVLLLGIAVGMYLLNAPETLNQLAASDTFSNCGPSGHCNDYGWNDNTGYTKVPTNCYVSLFKCHISKWDQAIKVGCQKNPVDPSKNLAYYAEIHKLSASNPNLNIWDKVVSGGDGNGHLKAFAPPQICGIWQIDVGPPCHFSFHMGGNRRDSICKAPAAQISSTTSSPKQTIAPMSTSCPVPGAITNLKIDCPLCNQSQ